MLHWMIQEGYWSLTTELFDKLLRISSDMCKKLLEESGAQSLGECNINIVILLHWPSFVIFYNHPHQRPFCSNYCHCYKTVVVIIYHLLLLIPKKQQSCQLSNVTEKNFEVNAGTAEGGGAD